jgi:hypothetical protein
MQAPGQSALLAAREALRHLTPLREDCGALCAAACCRDDGDEGLGMLLFPGEELLYGPQDENWMRLEASASYRLGEPVRLLICDGACPRERRPLACRIFPLAPVLREGEIAARIDARARFLCPLADSGVAGLDPDFVRAAERAFAILSADETQRAYLLWLADIVKKHARMLRDLRNQFR